MSGPHPLDPRRTALLMIDLQNDFLAPDGAYSRGGATSEAARALLYLFERDWGVQLLRGG